MSTNKQSDLVRTNTAVSSQSAAEIAAAETKAKPKNSAHPKEPAEATATDTVKPTHMVNVSSIEQAAKARAKADAVAIRDRAQEIYNRELALNLQGLLGEDADAYFRCPVESVALPALPTADYLQTVDCPALPSAN
jgi:hypothetical protein